MDNMKESFSLNELIMSVIVEIHNNDSILFTDVLEGIKSRGYSIDNANFSFHVSEKQAFTYCDKKNINFKIPLAATTPYLNLKIRGASTSIESDGPKPPKEAPADKSTKKDPSRRNKERKIGEIIEKVNEWRTYYTGTMDENGKQVKYSLEDASKVVGIAKKTLDDYLLQLRAGKKYGFDFQANKDAKVGMLRAFVKEKKAKEKNRSEASKQDGDESS